MDEYQARSLTSSITPAVTAINRFGSAINNLTSGVQKMYSESSRAKEIIDAEKSALKQLQEEVKRTNNPADKQVIVELQRDITKLELNKIANEFKSLSGIVNNLTKELDRLIVVIRQTQQTFGITAGQSVELEVRNLFASARSYIESVATFGAEAGVNRREIMGAQQSMQAQFGGVISSKDAAELARQAKELGITTQQLAQARRTFMTTTMGDMGRAAAEQDRFITVFQQKGLTSKDAMEAIGKNGELLARAGTRFADSFAKAAVESKKIGVELSKVNQVGDNIIGNFEGFLESQAELGAMGFGFDTSRLAEIAESGDTGALMDELRSQLAMTGKDLGSLRRSEQLALSSAFGIDIGELQRMAGPTPELTVQQESNKLLTRLVNFVEGFGKVFGVITALLGVIAANTAIRAVGSFVRGMPGLGGGVAKTGAATGAAPVAPLVPIPGRAGGIRALRPVRQARVVMRRGERLATSAINKVRPVASKAGSMTMAPTRLAVSGATRVATRLGTGGLLAGATGGLSGFMEARREGKDVATASGAAAVRGTGAGVGAAAGAALGTALLPGIGTAIGTVVGGFAGDTIGKALNKFAPGLSANVGALFKGIFAPIKAVFEPIKPAIDRLKESFSGIFELFSGEGNTISEFAKKALPVMETIGKVIGTLLTPAFFLLSVGIQSIIGVITFVMNVIKLFVAMLKGDGGGIKAAFNQLVKGIIDSFMGIVRSIPIIGKYFAEKNTTTSNTNASAVSQVNSQTRAERAAERRTTADARREERQANSWSAQRATSRTAEVSPTQTAADDMVSRPGYGQRTLVTPTTAVALNDEDNVVAYADDMISQNTGLELLSKGAISREMDTTSKVSVDLTALEKKLDQMIVAIQNMRDVSMDVKMDADLVGRAIVRSSERSMQSAVFRPMDV
jgi:hypothetical protein